MTLAALIHREANCSALRSNQSLPHAIGEECIHRSLSVKLPNSTELRNVLGGLLKASAARRVPGQPLEVTARPSCGLRHQRECNSLWCRRTSYAVRPASGQAIWGEDCLVQKFRKGLWLDGQSQASEDPFVDGGLAQGSTLSATASSFQPIDQRFKGKNALVALSQGMDISAARLVNIFTNFTLFTSSPTHWGRLAKNVECRVLVDVVGFNKYHLAQGKRENKDPEIEVHHRGSRGLNNIVDLGELIAGRDARTTIMLQNIPNKDGQPPSAQVAGVSLLGGPVACFDSGWLELFGDLVARRSVYGAHMLPRTTEFGVTIEEARHLKQKQKAANAGKGVAAQDAATQDGGGIWCGTQNNNLI
ncbi:mei2-like protein [Fusarium tjaetaba]|uniref:Mei2-like protein n=1 Tax=Fusarium tjaetaba TaxID=1567544 RepID=A0A8H5VKX1_9HYPO|nr:mei2-like protein [Fusarium tjaetaba]KAF5624739.1 mei2-like protein [Fusarium tjaetaba]